MRPARATFNLSSNFHHRGRDNNSTSSIASLDQNALKPLDMIILIGLKSVSSLLPNCFSLHSEMSFLENRLLCSLAGNKTSVAKHTARDS